MTDARLKKLQDLSVNPNSDWAKREWLKECICEIIDLRQQLATEKERFDGVTKKMFDEYLEKAKAYEKEIGELQDKLDYYEDRCNHCINVYEVESKE